MTREDDELNELMDEVTDGTYTLSFYEVILNLVKQIQTWGDTRIQKIVQVLAAEGIKISIAAHIWYSYVLNSVLQYTHPVYYYQHTDTQLCDRGENGNSDKFSQEGIFHYWSGRLPGHAHVNQTYPDVVRMWRQFHGCPASGGGIE